MGTVFHLTALPLIIRALPRVRAGVGEKQGVLVHWPVVRGDPQTIGDGVNNNYGYRVTFFCLLLLAKGERDTLISPAVGFTLVFLSATGPPTPAKKKLSDSFHTFVGIGTHFSSGHPVTHQV